MATNHNIDKLKINIMSKNDYQDFLDDESTEFNFNDLYVVGEYPNPLSLLHDPNNVISSKTYADVGREAVVTQNEEPTSPHTQIWIDPDEEVVYNLMKELLTNKDEYNRMSKSSNPYGDGNSSKYIVDAIIKKFQ